MPSFALGRWDEDISDITSRYLQGKYTSCDVGGDNCRAFCDRDDIEEVRRESEFLS